MGAVDQGLRALVALLRLRLEQRRGAEPAREAGAAALAALDAALDANALLALAEAHRVVPLVAQAFQQLGHVAGPGAPRVAATRGAFDAAARDGAVGALRALPVLRSVMDTLAAAGIEAMAWKGPALSLQAWGDAASRSFADLDIVVRSADRYRARSALRAAGWQGRHRMSDAQEDAIFAAQGAYELVRDDGALFVELHWRFGARRYSGYPPTSEVIARARTAALAGSRLMVPARSDAIVLHAVHATKHGWSTLEDVAVLARIADDEETLRDARRTAAVHGASRALALGELLAAELVGARAAAGASWPVSTRPAPDGAHPDAHVARLASQVRERWACGQTTWRSTLRWDLAWTEGLTRRARLLMRSALDPTLQEWQAVRLPPALGSLYRVVRMVRLVARAFRGGRRDRPDPGPTAMPPTR